MSSSDVSTQPVHRTNRPALDVTIAAAVAMIGLAMAGISMAATQRFLDRHFLPSFFLPRQWYVVIETTVRTAIIVVGLSLVAARSRVARVVARAPGPALRIAVAAVLAIGASELALRVVHLRPTEWLAPEEEPRREPDARLGWVLAPARTGSRVIGGRTIEYAVDPAGYRVRRVDEPVDVARPTIVFAGESVMSGEGLAWDETIPAQVGSMLGVQSANLAVHGYSTDQMYMRLDRELPRFRQPLAVVSLFMTTLFGRNLDRDRPHLDPGLVWQPAEHSSRLKSLATLLVPYRTEATVDRGVTMTREVLRATVNLARARGIAALVVVPQFGPEDQAQRALRQRVISNDIPSLLVTIETNWRLPWDRHPNARAAHAIAEAIAARLRPR